MEPAYSLRPKLPTAKWGAACAPCSAAKAKCIRSNPSSSAKCDRCQRLYKNCGEQVHRPRKKRESRPSRTTQLETKLNSLVNYLKVSGDWEKASGDLDIDPASLTTRSEASGPHCSPSASLSESCRSSRSGVETWSVPETYNSYAPSTCFCRAENEDSPPPPGTDEALLDIYRNELTANHPFVVIPPSVTAAELNDTRPFLMSAIRMVASYRSLRSMRAQMYRLMAHLSDHVLVRSERSTDLLMGLVVILGWHQYHCLMHAQLSNLVALACTLVSDMGLNRTPRQAAQPLLMISRPTAPRPRTNEERRALAGVWFLSSAVSTGFDRIDSMRYTCYLDDCIKHLEVCSEYPSDEMLVALVRVQCVTERITRVGSEDWRFDEGASFSSAPMSAYTNLFNTELENITKNLSPNLRSNHVILTYLKTARLRLHEPTAVDSTLVTALCESLTSTRLGTGSPLDQVYQSASCLRDWFDHWLSIPSEQYHLHTTSVVSQLVYALVMLFRWARLAGPRTSHGKEATPMPAETSASNTRDLLYGTTISSPSTEGAATSLNAQPDDGRVPCVTGVVHFPANTDPTLTAAIATLRARLRKQPGLRIDTPVILSMVCTRFEGAHAVLQAVNVEPEEVDRNIWSTSAIKLRITKFKLERWVEVVAAKADALIRADSAYPPPPPGVGNGLHGHGFGCVPSGVVGQGPEDIGLSLPFGDGDLWMDELTDGLDPSIWLEGNLDWETTGMVSIV